ncbi:hypothetical protein T06_10496 [Trichinella sp. T6]|nr:hypothetical protein T06_10496 [Trichinella sp. T6]
MDANASVKACSCGHELTNTSMSSTSTDGRSRCSSTSWSQSVVQRRWRSLAVKLRDMSSEHKFLGN